MKTTVLPATADCVLTAASGVDRHVLEQLVHHLEIVRLAEELRDRLGDHIADAVDGS